jgi:folate-binding protein YgfZ
MSEKTMAFAEREYDYLVCTGTDAVDLLGRISTGDLRPLHKDMTTGLTAFTSNQGKMLDWCVAIQSSKGFLVRCSKGRGLKIKEWIEKYIIMEDANVSDVSAHWKSYVVQGVTDPAVLGLSALPQAGSLSMANDTLYIPCLPGMDDYVEVAVEADKAEDLENQFKANGLGALDLEVLEHARIMAGVPSPDYEFSKDINPLELRLADTSICFDKGCYIGQEVIARMDSYDKTARLLIGFECGQELALDSSMRLRCDGKSYGKVTSILNEDGASIGLAIAQRDAFELDSVELTWEGGSAPVKLFDRPFWSA